MENDKENEKGGKRHLQGVVVKRSGKNTVAVETLRYVAHVVYGKNKQITTKYLVHDVKDDAQVGDSVTICESRPISKHKRFVIVSHHKKITSHL